jgi:hypothetical protein
MVANPSGEYARLTKSVYRFSSSKGDNLLGLTRATARRF